MEDKLLTTDDHIFEIVDETICKYAGECSGCFQFRNLCCGCNGIIYKCVHTDENWSKTICGKFVIKL